MSSLDRSQLGAPNIINKDMAKKHILTINGGGSLGLIVALLLEKIEKETGIPSYSQFDLISGASTGAIIGMCLAHGMPASDIVKLYKNLIPKVFGNPNPSWKIWKAKYSSDLLEDVLKEYLNFPLNDVKTRFMCHAVKISEPCLMPVFFKSWRNDQPLAWQAIQASCSAPTFFDPMKIGNDIFVDGGVCANNPSTSALAESIRLGNELEDIFMLNLAAYTCPGYEHADGIKGVMHWATKIGSTFVSVSDPLADYQCQQFLQEKYCAVDPRFDGPLDFLDIDRMEHIADQTWEAYKEIILKNVNQVIY